MTATMAGPPAEREPSMDMIIHEQFVDLALGNLRFCGWSAECFGQGQLSQAARDVLKHYTDEQGRPTPIRWMPDIIAVRAQRAKVALIDVKTRSLRYPHSWAVNEHCLQSLEVFGKTMLVPVYFLMDDWTVRTPEEVWTGEQKPDTKYPGQHFRRVTTSMLCSTFETVFGKSS
jgi:hypothetical protein